ncbi:LOW QUALITY PROTEIN: kelch-like ECH-associated protein 1 [Babylonia areolata]|uniref:LOW QUALITY PROTEIN: kelch-like ECH-associated protein 1 n=1 Tax=Babylonia areolata TaxID=304850 RepID=UPI003FD31C41
MAQTPPMACYRPKPMMTQKPADGSMLFNIMKHPKEAMEVMHNLLVSRKLCDISLKIGSEEVKAHKLVLASASPYFRAMFTGGMREEDMSCITLQGMSACTLNTLVEFAYTSEVRISESNVCHLLAAATMLQMSHVVEACSVFLEHQLDPSNCIGIAEFAAAHGCLELEQKARTFILKRFCEVIQGEEFNTLTYGQVCALLSKDELNIKCESEVYKAVIRWVQHDMDNRLCKLDSLLAGVRLTNLAPCFLEQQLKNCPILRKQPQCVKTLADQLEKLKMHKAGGDCPRMPCFPLVIFCVGGYLRQSLSNFECYNPKTLQWHRLPDLPTPRSGLGAVMVKGSLYVVGGRNNSHEGNMDSDGLNMFDAMRHIWVPRRPMSVPRNRVAVGVIDNMIYAVGGSQGQTHHNSAERYNPETDTWEMIASMRTRRIGVGCAVINRLLFVVGGFDGVNRLSCVECYNPEKNEWKSVAPMNTMRSGAGVVAMGSYIYAVGGYDSSCQLRSVERYNLEKNCWQFMTPMNSPRSALSVAVVCNRLYALGGYDGHNFLTSVEMYNPDTNDWKEVTTMTCGRSGHGVTVGAEPPLR